MKKFTALFLTLVIILLSLPMISVSAETDDRYGRSLLATMSNSDNLTTVYDYLVEACNEDEEPEISAQDYDIKNFGINTEELKIAYEMFYRDYPEYFWIKNGGYSYGVSNGVVVSIMPSYIEDFESNLSEYKRLYNEKVSVLIYGLDNKSEYEKAKILHDRLAETVTYTVTGAKDQTPYGALVEGKCVCNGYARAYQHLLQEVGVASWYVNGVSEEPQSKQLIKHAWNMVNIDENWYYTDVTWDDTGNLGFYTYFNITTQQLKEDHIIGEFEEYLPIATETSNNYYIKENLVFNNYDKDRLINLLKNKENKTQIYLNCDFNDFVKKFENDSMSIAIALGATENYAVTKYGLGNTLIIDFKIDVQHEYYNACDTTCNICGKTRKITEHTYDHCFDGFEIQLYGSWEIDITQTGIYLLKPNSTVVSEYNLHDIVIYDKKGKQIKYNESKGGFPLVADQSYTIKFRYDCSDEITGAVTWTKTKKFDTIFPDTSAGDWYNNAVTYAVGAGIINGYGDGTFGPGNNIQRQDFLVILAKLEGVDLEAYGKKKSAFSDVPEGSYYEAAINWGAENNIVSGYANGKFGVGDNVTREQLVRFLYNYANYKGIDTSYKSSTKTSVKNKYKDYKAVSDWAQDCVLWAIEKGIISGTTETTISPSGNALRCQVAQIMYNIYLKEIF